MGLYCKGLGLGLLAYIGLGLKPWVTDSLKIHHGRSMYTYIPDELPTEELFYSHTICTLGTWTPRGNVRLRSSG